MNRKSFLILNTENVYQFIHTGKLHCQTSIDAYPL